MPKHIAEKEEEQEGAGISKGQDGKRGAQWETKLISEPFLLEIAFVGLLRSTMSFSGCLQCKL